jgi:hypothetical protein
LAGTEAKDAIAVCSTKTKAQAQRRKHKDVSALPKIFHKPREVVVTLERSLHDPLVTHTHIAPVVHFRNRAVSPL